MSFDHKPEDTPERDRIENAGGKVTPDGRVNGGLNLSRAIGDHAYKTNKNLPLQGKETFVSFATILVMFIIIVYVFVCLKQYLMTSGKCCYIH